MLEFEQDFKNGYRKLLGYHVMKRNGLILKEVNYRDRAYTKLKTTVTKDGYARVSLTFNGVSKQFYVHSVVAACFMENWTPGCRVGHKNGDRLDNSLENLYIKRYKGLTDEQVKDIENSEDVSQRLLAERYGTNKSMIQRILKNKENNDKRQHDIG